MQEVIVLVSAGREGAGQQRADGEEVNDLGGDLQEVNASMSIGRGIAER